MNYPVKPLSRLLLIAILAVACLLIVRGVIRTTESDRLHYMPPHPVLIEKLRSENLTAPDLSAKLSQGINAPGHVLQPPTGEFNLLVVLVEFVDNQKIVNPQEYDNLFFNTFNYDSVADYYLEVSSDSLALTTSDLPSATKWITATHTYNGPYGYVNADQQTGTDDDFGWGAYPQNLQGIVADTIPLIDDEIDFSEYDNDGDGFVDGVVFVHAGPAGELTFPPDPNEIWSAAWDMSTGSAPGPIMTGDGVYVDDFIFGPEFLVNPGDVTIGVFTHELGHALFGLPDLYDLDQSSYGVGDWSVMSYGAWNGSPINVPGVGMVSSGDSPAWPDAWSRIKMGFDTPETITQNTPMYEFAPVENGGSVVKLRSPGLGANEYYLVEYRDQQGYDTELPAAGLLIWHVDEAKWNRWDLNLAECEFSPNCACDQDNPLLALEQADGDFDLETHNNTGDAGDPFPTFGNYSFKFDTNPESGSYYASSCPTNSCIGVENITSSNGTISADLKVICQVQGACVNILTDPVLGWGKAGEESVYKASIQNCGYADDNLTLSYEGDWLTGFFDLESGEAITATEVPTGGAWDIGITVTVPADALWSATEMLSLTVSSANDTGISTTAWVTTTVPYCTLVVDDDRGAPDVESAYTEALQGAGFDFDLWDVQLMGSPDEATLAVHEAVVWFTGVPSRQTLTPHDEIALSSYLDSGGEFFFSSQEYLTDTLRDYFGRQYLRVSTFVDNMGAQVVTGVPGNPLSGGLGPYTLSLTATLSDQVLPLSSTLSAFTDESGITNALTYDPGSWRILFQGWPFENLSGEDGVELMASTLSWMDVLPRPQVGFQAEDSPVCTGMEITFTNTSSYASEYLWSFGDGVTSTLTDTLHVFNEPMTATVALTGTNCCGYAVVTETIAVLESPQVEFTPAVEVVYIHQPVTFTVLTTETVALSYTWDFGDGTDQSREVNPIHKFSQSGWYTITLASRDDLCTGITTMNLYVRPLIYLPLMLKEPHPNANVLDIGDESARFALAALSASSLGFMVIRPFKRR